MGKCLENCSQYFQGGAFQNMYHGKICHNSRWWLSKYSKVTLPNEIVFNKVARFSSAQTSRAVTSTLSVKASPPPFLRDELTVYLGQPQLYFVRTDAHARPQVFQRNGNIFWGR